MKTQNGIISVVIPVFNRQNVIEECITSVISQSYLSFEIILIDDGSTDNTLNICKKLSETNPKIKLLKSEHKGVSAARNLGLSAAEGEYIFFLDSDDVIAPPLFETLVNAFKNSDAAIAGTEVVNVSEKNWHKVEERLLSTYETGETVYHSHEDSLEAMFMRSSPLMLIGGIMMRRDLIGETKFKTDLFIGEDFYFIYENLIKGASTVFLKQKWYYSRMHANNSSWNYSFSGFWTRFHRREIVWKSEEAFGRTKYANVQKVNAFHCFLLCMHHHKPFDKDLKLMRKTLRKYKKILFPAFERSDKLRYYLYVYLPFAKTPIYKLETALMKLLHRNKN